jgi:AraC family transcriptional regulator of adaptative response/methylated-DNA-[protein]-cysteine methyltransferase
MQVTTNMPAVTNNPELWNAVLERDASRDGSFVFAVRSTGIYCRPSCPARRPKREQVRFFQVPEAAEQAGFRACKRCHPRQARISDPQIELVRRICHIIDEHDEESITLERLSAITGTSAHHLQRTFKQLMESRRDNTASRGSCIASKKA